MFKMFVLRDVLRDSTQMILGKDPKYVLEWNIDFAYGVSQIGRDAMYSTGLIRHIMGKTTKDVLEVGGGGRSLLEFPWSHLHSCGLNWAQLVYLGLTRSHSVSLDLI